MKKIFLAVCMFMTIGAIKAVDVTPSQLNFQCGTQIQSLDAQSINPVQSQPRFTLPDIKPQSYDKIEQEIADKGSTDVIVSFNLDSSEVVGNNVWERINFCQGRTINEVASFHSQIHRAYENVPAIFMNIDSETLNHLQNSPIVGFIEPVITIEENTAQGVPLMGGDVYRSIYNGSGVSIAIVDSGIDYNHAALGGGGFPNSKVIGGYDFGDGDSDPMPSGSSHGTNVAGIAAGGITNNPSYPNYIGGVAPGSKLYALKVMPDGSTSTDTAKLTAAVDWCVSHKLDDPANPILAINMSVGGGKYTSSCDSTSVAMTNAVNAAVAAGITVLASSGNEGYCDSVGLPACVSNVISVGAVFDNYIGTLGFCLNELSCIGTTSTSCTSPQKYYSMLTAADKVAPYSNSASFLDILAPSHNASTPTLSGGYINNFGGTSAACPYACGAVAALQCAAKDIIGRFLTFAEVKAMLVQNGDMIADTKTSITKPRINLARSIESTDVFNGQQISLTNTSKSSSATVNSITFPYWVNVYPQAPFSIAKNQSATLYAQTDCGYCNYENFIGSIDISGIAPPSTNYTLNVAVNMNCPACQFLANLNAGCTVDLADLAILTDCWLSSAVGCQNADINNSGIVSLGDFAIMASEWIVQ